MEFIDYEVVDRVAVITLDRPDKANAVHGPMLDEPTRIIDALVAHRLERECKVLAALARVGAGDLDRLRSAIAQG